MTQATPQVCISFARSHPASRSVTPEWEQQVNQLHAVYEAAPELLDAVQVLYRRLPDDMARDLGWIESLLDRCGKPYKAEAR